MFILDYFFFYDNCYLLLESPRSIDPNLDDQAALQQALVQLQSTFVRERIETARRSTAPGTVYPIHTKKKKY